MTQLAREVADALRPFEPSAVTDVTGFGLLGHAYESPSGAPFGRPDAAALPVLPGALELAREGVRTGGDRRNRDFAGGAVDARRLTSCLRSRTTRRRRAGSSSRCPPRRRRRLRASFAAGELFFARVGRVEAGPGVVLA